LQWPGLTPKTFGARRFFTNEFFPKSVRQGCPENIFPKIGVGVGLG